MSISVNAYVNATSVSATQTTENGAASAQAGSVTASVTVTSSQDSISISKEGREKSNKLSGSQVDELWNQQQEQLEKFKLMLQRMLGKQAENGRIDAKRKDQVQNDAAAAIAEGGEYSVDAVSTRIMNMAQALAGGDMSKLQVLKDAVTEGFRQVAGMFGGDTNGDSWMSALPQVSQDTYTEIMSRFDDWEASANADAVQE